VIVAGPEGGQPLGHHGVDELAGDLGPVEQEPGEDRPELAALAASGRLTVPIWRSYPLAEAAQAHADLETHRNHGKIILLP
jgi:NADPH:quinone reductase-like Zn-dependent oxidoreductase